MPAVRDVLATLERIAPKRFAFDFDKVGLQVGNPDAPVSIAAVSLDRSLGAVDFARSIGAQLLLSHHPLIFAPLNTVDTRTHTGRTVLQLAKHDISFIAAHTNWDSAIGGINDVLARILNLEKVVSFGSAADVKRLKLVFFCPIADVDRVVDAVSAAGAGVIGAYRRCAFSSRGEGTFIGDETTNPTVGEAGRQEKVDEMRVEMTLRADQASVVSRALKKAHPYEEPAFDLVTLAPIAEQPAGRLGVLAEPMTLREFAMLVDSRLDTRSLAWGDPEKRIRRVAVVGGAADSDWIAAQRADADVLVTGEVKQHIAVEASESGMCILASGHYATEHPGSAGLRDRMAEEMPDIDWHLFTPAPGMHGRPF